MNKRRNRVLVGVIVVFALIALGACGYLVYKTISSNISAEEYNNVASSFAPQIEETEDPKVTRPENVDTEKAENPVNVAELSETNSDIYAWIYIPDTNVNYPVAQSADEDNFYLDHDMYKNYSFPGTIYSQACNSLNWTDRVTVLYGHNMLNGSMFATLHNFGDTDFFNEHPYFYIYTKDRKLTYEIVTAFDYDSRHIMNSFDFKDDKVFQDWIDQAKNPRSLNANVRDSVALDLNSKFVVLSTCLNYGDGRYLVQGVLVKDERTE
ncbi:MAG: class B sortase [Ruminococcus sp.]|nr:class B sortase [Ruminococcus sp.]